MTMTSRNVHSKLFYVVALTCVCIAAAACGEGEGGMEEEAGELGRFEAAVTGCGPVCEKLCYIHLYRCRDNCDGLQSCETDCYDKGTACHNGCNGDAACENQCVVDQRACSNKCTFSSKCDLACTQAHIKCVKGCTCSEECITDAQCGPGEVCTGVPGSRKCMVPPEV